MQILVLYAEFAQWFVSSYMNGKELMILLEKLILQGGYFFKKLLPFLLELQKTLLQFTIFMARFICREHRNHSIKCACVRAVLRHTTY